MTRVRFMIADGEKIVATYNVKIVEEGKGEAFGETDNPKDCAVLLRKELRVNKDFPSVILFNYGYADDKAPEPETKKRDWGKNYTDILREEKAQEKAKAKEVAQNTDVDGEEVNNMSKKQDAGTPATPATPEVKKVSVASIIVANKDKSFEEIVKIVKAQRPDVADSTIKVQYNKAKKG